MQILKSGWFCPLEHRCYVVALLKTPYAVIVSIADPSAILAHLLD